MWQGLFDCACKQLPVFAGYVLIMTEPAPGRPGGKQKEKRFLIRSQYSES